MKGINKKIASIFLMMLSMVTIGASIKTSAMWPKKCHNSNSLSSVLLRINPEDWSNLINILERMIRQQNQTEVEMNSTTDRSSDTHENNNVPTVSPIITNITLQRLLDAGRNNNLPSAPDWF